MATRSVQGPIWVDTAMVDGDVRVSGPAGRLPAYLMSQSTYRALALCSGALARLTDALYDQRGTFRVPRSVIEPEAAEDLLLGLSLVDAEPSAVCINPPCGLPAEVVRDGFPLCGHHAALMESWDDLLG